VRPAKSRTNWGVQPFRRAPVRGARCEFLCRLPFSSVAIEVTSCAALSRSLAKSPPSSWRPRLASSGAHLRPCLLSAAATHAAMLHGDGSDATTACAAFRRRFSACSSRRRASLAAFAGFVSWYAGSTGRPRTLRGASSSSESLRIACTRGKCPGAERVCV
jgi:hypothetical protein